MLMTVLSFRASQTPVRDQGDRPTCAVFAVTAAHEWMRADGSDLSEESALWSANRVSGGTAPHATVRDGLQGISADGQAREEDWPYGSPAHPAGPPSGAVDPVNRVRPGPWRQLASVAIRDLERVLRCGDALMLTVAFVRQAWRDAQDDGYVDAPPGEPVPIAGHAVLATGINTMADGTAVIEFKNSWDIDWGDDGYGFLSESYWTRYGRKAFALKGIE